MCISISLSAVLLFFLPMNQLFDLSKIAFADIIDLEKPWLSLANIESYLKDNQKNFINRGYFLQNEALIHKNAQIDKSANIEGLALIGAGSEIRDNALIRKGVIIGNNCKIGHATEIKHSIIMDNTSAGHFNYIGDSIVGSHVNFGAGAILANLKSGSKNKTISIDFFGEKVSTNLEKLGSIIADNVKIGSNAVLNPGTVIGQNSIIYPLTNIRGFIPENKIVKNNLKTEISEKE